MSDKIIRRKGNSLYLGLNTINRPYKPVYQVPSYADLGAYLNEIKSLAKGAWGDLKDFTTSKDSSIMDLLNGSGKKVSDLAPNLTKAVGKVGSAMGTGMNMYDAFQYGSQLKDMSDLEGQISDARNFSSSAGTLDQLQTDALGLQIFDTMYGKDIMAHNGWQIAGHTLKDAGKTLLTAKGGPVAKILQAAAVAGAGLAGGIRGKLRADLDAGMYNAQQDDAILAGLTNIDQTNDWITRNNFGNAIIQNGLGAYGGLLPMMTRPKKRLFAYGGSLNSSGDFSNGVTYINEGGSHENNPLEGVPMGMAPDGTPNLVEEGEVIYDDYVFSNRLYAKESELEDGLLSKKHKNKTFAKIAEDLSLESEERPLDPISLRTLDANMKRLTAIQEKQKQAKAEKQAKAQFEALTPEEQSALQQNAEQNMIQEMGAGTQEMPYAHGGHLFFNGGPDYPTPFALVPRFREIYADVPEPVFSEPEQSIADIGKSITGVKPVKPVSEVDLSKYQEQLPDGSDNIPLEPQGVGILPTWMRYVPVFGGAWSAANDIFGGRPDYSSSRRLESTARGIPNVGFSPVGQYMEFNPMDRNFLVNTMQNNQAAARRAMTGLNAGMMNSALLAAGLTQGSEYANALAQMEQYNNQQRGQALEFNKGTDSFNSEGSMRAQVANAENAARRASILAEAVKMREAERLRGMESRSVNLTNLFDNIGNVGKENMAFNMVNTNRSQYYTISPNGVINYKKGYWDADPELRSYIEQDAKRQLGLKGSHGGYLTIKKKR